MPVETLSLSVSSPKSAGKKTINGSLVESTPGLVLPIELANNCSEEGITIESDNVGLTNEIRKHFLVGFGHRDLNGMISNYSDDALVISVSTSSTGGNDHVKYHGHSEIRNYLENNFFQMHPAGESSFHLEHISVEQKHAMVIWSAKTPTLVVAQGSDTLVFNVDGKISKHFSTCQTHIREDPGTARLVRKEEKNCKEFFE